ncbi:MAG: trigger factor [Desulfitobacteriaceae bacterium]|nr:trigger factor [Desulfitobacteriaceae bacterium]MDI6879129.1 trigger factor [Desulfitobacteriaceae bacterium]MDI6913284.1 trigger factor [Desulfitobacteriaceae bacterium]
MSVKLEKIEKNVVALEVSVDAKKFSDAVGRAAKTLAHRVNIPGFRKGKAPRRLVELHVGTEALYNEAIDHLLGSSYAQAVEESGIDPVDRPEVELVQIEDGKDLVYKAKVTVRPEVELGEYKGLNVEKEAVVVDDAAVEAELKRKQEQYAKVVPMETGNVEKGDTVTLDFDGFVDGVAFEGGKGEDHELIIGSGTFIPGFEEQLVGVEIGQEVDVNVQFPAEYHSAELAGKDALFKVKVNGIKRKELTPLDDEFAKDVSEFSTLDELKEDTRKKLLEAEEKRVETAYRNAVVAQAVDNASVEIPEVMFHSQIDFMMRQFEEGLSYQGLNSEQYYRYTNSNEQDMRERYRSQAAETIKTELVIEAIAKAEGISVSDEELDREIVKLAEKYNQTATSLRDSLLQRDEMKFFRSNLVTEKTVEFLVVNNA